MKLKVLVALSLGFIFIALIAACANAESIQEGMGEEAGGEKISWDPAFSMPSCTAHEEAPVLDEALEIAGLNRDNIGITRTDLIQSGYYAGPYLHDEFLRPWFGNLLENPLLAGCFEGEVVGALDYYIERPHPVAGIIRHATSLVGAPVDKEPPLDPAHLPDDFGQAIEALCDVVGECGKPESEIPPELAETLTPLIWTIIEGIKARNKMDEELSKHRDAGWWHLNGSNLLFPIPGVERPNPTNPQERGYLSGVGARRDLYHAAARIAFSVEDADWSPFVGLMGVKYDLSTGAGWIRIRDGSDNLYPDDGEDVLLLLDLCGNDEHLDPVASNTSAANKVSIAIDLCGQDTYHYEARKTFYDKEGLLPADKDGRYPGDEYYGNISLSRQGRQGAAHNGIAMLFDFGNDNDRFESLRCSQGCAYLGVGVLFVEGGDNVFLSESNSQGSGQFGIGLLIVKSKGNDTYESFTSSQGFGFVAGVGIAWDGGGNDKYVCNIGDPKLGGIPLYYTPQLPGKGNSSFCQGAGYGLRGNDELPKSFLSGGIGILRNLWGDDIYVASVFAQASAYWHGTGILSDGGGSDSYDALWYVQAGSAHYAVAMLFDSGEGGDRFNETWPPVAVTLGTSSDFGLSVFVNEGSSDEDENTYNITNLSAGASNCNSIGIFVVNGGKNHIKASSNHRGSGMGSSGGCQEERPDAFSAGLMIVVGENTYEYPENIKFPIPKKGSIWGHKQNNLPSEHGAGLDRPEGETGIHAESSRIK